MLALIQRVTQANVKVNDAVIGAIQHGILAFIGIEKNDTNAQAEKLLNKILHYRIFADADGKTNLSLQDINGGLLLVPQFTLAADTASGLRPSFSSAMSPSASVVLFKYLLNYARQHYASIATGEFGADMQVSLVNDGPMTFILRV